MKPEVRRALWALIFLSPALLLFLFLVVFPLGWALWLSLQDWSFMHNRGFVGLDNYARLLRDPLFWRSLRVTGTWTLGVVPSVLLLGLLLATALNSPWMRFRALFLAGYFLPVVTSMVAAAFVWRWLFDPGFGVINQALGLVGVGRPGWLADPRYALAATMLVGTWKQIGFAMIVLLAGLQTIPQELLEAARIDGAGRWQTFRRVTLPLMNPVLLFTGVLLVINALRVFTIPFVMSSGGLQLRTPGGPLDATRVIALHIYQVGFDQFALGYASANAFALMMLIMSATLIQMRVLRRPFEY